MKYLGHRAHVDTPSTKPVPKLGCSSPYNEKISLTINIGYANLYLNREVPRIGRQHEVGVECMPGCMELLNPPVDCERVVRGWPLATGDDAEDVGESPNPELAIDCLCWLNDIDRCDG